MLSKNEKNIEDKESNFTSYRVLNGTAPIDEPWIGSCRYLLCFTSMVIYLEKYNQSERERIYKSNLVVTGMGLVTHWDSINYNKNQCYYLANNYIETSMKCAGYTYNTTKKDECFSNKNVLFENIKNSIDENKPVLSCFNSSNAEDWELITGYDSRNMSIVLRKKNDLENIDNWFESIDSIVCVIDTGLKKTDLYSVLKNIVMIMEERTSGSSIMSIDAYENMINFLQDDSNFINMTSETQHKIYKSIDIFAGYHAEARGFSGEGFRYLLEPLCRESELMSNLKNKLTYWCDQFHQISWIIWNTINVQWGRNVPGHDKIIKDPKIRSIIIYALYMMIERDKVIVDEVKKYCSINTPNVFIPFNPLIKELMDTIIRVEEKNLQDIMKCIKVKKQTVVNLKNKLDVHGNVTYSINDSAINIHCHNEHSYVATKKTYSIPLKINMTVKTDSTNVHIYFDRGQVMLEGWRHIPGELRIHDPATGLDLGYPDKSIIPVNEYFDVSWIIHKNFTALIINGEVRHYGENYPYMHFDFTPSPVRLGSAKGSTIDVQSLIISQLY